MRILHTSDWHLGRTFHGANVTAHLSEVLHGIAQTVRDKQIDLVLVAGDIFDHAAPAAELYTLLDDVIRSIVQAGAKIVMTSGNHDNASRLGAKAEWAALGGVHFVARPDAYLNPIEFEDQHGVVDVYPIAYLEPMLVRDYFEKPRPRTQQEVLTRVTNDINELISRRKNRSIIMSHCFATGNISADDEADSAEELQRDLQRDITAGGVDLVSAELFRSADYAALGHIHSRQTLLPHVRYSGAPLHLNFREAGRPRGAWIINLDASGLSEVEWLPFQVPRKLSRLVGTLAELLESEEFAEFENDWVEAQLTDAIRPVDAMRRLQTRFAHCVHLSFIEHGNERTTKNSYAKRSRGKSEFEIIDEFLEFVRDGHAATAEEQTILRDVLSTIHSADAHGKAPGA